LYRHVGEDLKRIKDGDNGDTTKRRSRLDIIAKILETATDGAFKTKIMYKANLNFDQINEYAKCLLEAQLIRIIRSGGKTMYVTTDKGKLLLRRFNETEEIINAANNRGDDKLQIAKKGSIVYVMKK
jgi:predicted transcriptional regulator